MCCSRYPPLPPGSPCPPQLITSINQSIPLPLLPSHPRANSSSKQSLLSPCANKTLATIKLCRKSLNIFAGCDLKKKVILIIHVGFDLISRNKTSGFLRTCVCVYIKELLNCSNTSMSPKNFVKKIKIATTSVPSWVQPFHPTQVLPGRDFAIFVPRVAALATVKRRGIGPHMRPPAAVRGICRGAGRQSNTLALINR